MSRRPPVRLGLARPSAAALLVALIAGCSSPGAPSEHPLAGRWRGAATFAPSTAAYRAATADVALTVADDGTLTGTLALPGVAPAALGGAVGRDGALRVAFDRFTAEGRLHRAPRDRATGSGVQREGAATVGVITLDLSRP
jgi:hypothetical protein